MTTSDTAFATPDFASANGVYCKYCGATPAVKLDFRAHRGLILFMQMRNLPGPYCRNCGIAVFRHMTADSLVQGWWGPISFVVVNPLTILSNVVNRGRIGRLAPPIPGGPSQPMDEGKPLVQRWQFFGFFIPLIAIGSVIASAAGSQSSSGSGYSSYPTYPRTTYTAPYAVIPSVPAVPKTTARTDPGFAVAGDCIHNTHGPLATDDDPVLVIVPCTDPQAEAEVIARPTGPLADNQCDTDYPEADMVFTHTTRYGSGPEIQTYALCVRMK
ncbi:LppU/SCO3897 family protein [Nocardia jejuensis]|uniref:LppU/SCO3897 family protein n=1 Tax=Nocardia jejuensis TaxID=328049 RepID=UPI0012F9D2E0|nr:hypothetical protein [Nocardia jejuensis]